MDRRVETYISENYENILQWSKQATHNHSDYIDLAHDIIIAFQEHELAPSLVEKGEARWFIVRMLLNQARSNTSPFKRNHRIIHEGYVPDNREEEDYDMETDLRIEALQTAIEEIIAELNKDLIGDKFVRYCMDVVLWTLKQKKPNFSEIERETGIPRTSISNAYYNGLDMIKKRILDNGYNL